MTPAEIRANVVIRAAREAPNKLRDVVLWAQQCARLDALIEAVDDVMRHTPRAQRDRIARSIERLRDGDANG